MLYSGWEEKVKVSFMFCSCAGQIDQRTARSIARDAPPLHVLHAMRLSSES